MTPAEQILRSIEEMEELAKKNDELICDLASGKKKWRMCVPPQADDTDMALIELPRERVPNLLLALRETVKALEYYRKADPLIESTIMGRWPTTSERALQSAAQILGVKP